MNGLHSSFVMRTYSIKTVHYQDDKFSPAANEHENPLIVEAFKQGKGGWASFNLLNKSGLSLNFGRLTLVMVSLLLIVSF